MLYNIPASSSQLVKSSKRMATKAKTLRSILSTSGFSESGADAPVVSVESTVRSWLRIQGDENKDPVHVCALTPLDSSADLVFREAADKRADVEGEIGWGAKRRSQRVNINIDRRIH
jgi:hypothetical protein